MLLTKLRAAIKALDDEIKGILAKDSATDEELTTLSTKTAEMEKLKKQVDAALAAEAASESVKSTDAGQEQTTIALAPARVGSSTKLADAVAETGMKKGVIKLALLATAVASHKAATGMFSSPQDALAKNGWAEVANEVEFYVKKSLQAGVAAQGGILVPEDWNFDILEFLRPNTSFLAAGPRRQPMPNGNYNQPAGAAGAVAHYGVELQNAQVTEPRFSAINMNAKELTALVPISNQLLDFGIPSVRTFVENDLRDAMSEAMDQAMWIGDGLQGRPLGVFNTNGVNIIEWNGSSSPTIAQIDAFARQLMNVLTLNFINTRRGVWIMGTNTAGYIEDLRDGIAGKAFPTMGGLNPTFKGYPVFVTTNLPQNLGDGGDSYMAFVAMDRVLFGEATGMTLQVSTEAAYYDAGGNMRSAFQRGETIIKSLMRHDVAVSHLDAVAVSPNVNWGSGF